MMKKLLFVLLVMSAWITSCKKDVLISVSNISDADRKNEIVEITTDLPETDFIVVDASGKEVPYQITYNEKLLLQVSVPASQTVTYKMKKGKPAEYDIVTAGKQYPERVDDIAWENDRIAFRLYGPALQASGEKAFGYDIWVKRTDKLVVEERYRKELRDGITYHKDNGNGLDYYKVGPTLGAGTSALIDNGQLVYPYCYKDFEILDNGPLRFTVRLVYNPITVGENNHIVEKRLLSLDAGTHLNKVTLTYEGLDKPTTIATGIVLHDDTDNYVINVKNGYMTYADPADKKEGQTFLAAVFPKGMTKAEAVYFDKKEQKERGAYGHLLAYNSYQPKSEYTYYFGAGWSKWGFKNKEEWLGYVQKKAEALKHPLIVSVSK